MHVTFLRDDGEGADGLISSECGVGVGDAMDTQEEAPRQIDFERTRVAANCCRFTHVARVAFFLAPATRDMSFRRTYSLSVGPSARRLYSGR